MLSFPPHLIVLTGHFEEKDYLTDRDALPDGILEPANRRISLRGPVPASQIHLMGSLLRHHDRASCCVQRSADWHSLRACFNSAAVWNRSTGYVWRQFRMTPSTSAGMPDDSSDGGVTGVSKCAAITSLALRSGKSVRPVNRK